MDFPWPSFAHIGEQEVYDYELWGKVTQDTSTLFGYQDRYAEMKYGVNRIIGDLRDTLKFWTTVSDFGTTSGPSLNASFVECDEAEMKRIFVDQTGDQILFDIHNGLRAMRCLPKRSVPML